MKVFKSLMFVVFTALIVGAFAGCGGGGGGGGNSGDGGVTGDYDWKWVVFHTGNKNEYLYSFVRPYEYTLAYPGNDTELFEDYLPDLAVAPVQEWPDYRGVDKMFLPQGSYTFCYEIFHPDTYSWTHRIIGSLPNDPAVVLSPASSENIPEGVYVYDAWTQYDTAGKCPGSGGGGGGGTPPSGGSAIVNVENAGDYPISGFYLSPSSSGSWQNNFVPEGKVLPEGGRTTLTINNCNQEYDYKVVFYENAYTAQENYNNYLECGNEYLLQVGINLSGTTGEKISSDIKINKKQIQ